MSTGSDEPTHGQEYPPLEDTAPPTDPHAPVEYPTDSAAQPPNYAAHAEFQPPGPPQPGYAESGYPQPGPPPPGYPQPGYPQPGYPPPGYPPPGYPQMGYPTTGSPPTGYPSPYEGGYGYAYDPYAQGSPVGTNGKAIGALVTSLAGLIFCGVPSIVGLILGIIAMRETKRTGQEGHGMALAGVIVGGLSVAGWLLYGVVVIIALAVTSTSSYGY